MQTLKWQNKPVFLNYDTNKENEWISAKGSVEGLAATNTMIFVIEVNFQHIHFWIDTFIEYTKYINWYFFMVKHGNFYICEELQD